MQLKEEDGNDMAHSPRDTALNRISSEIDSYSNSEEIVTGEYKSKVLSPRISVRKINSLRSDHCAIQKNIVPVRAFDQPRKIETSYLYRIRGNSHFSYCSGENFHKKNGKINYEYNTITISGHNLTICQ